MGIRRVLADVSTWLNTSIGERGIIMLCGMMILTISLSAVDWRLAGTVAGAIMVAIALAPLFASLFRGPPRQGGQG